MILVVLDPRFCSDRWTLSERGPQHERILLVQVRRKHRVEVLTDVHEVWQVEQAANIVDALQVPAFLRRQTDSLEAVGASGRPVYVKKEQWMHPEAMERAVTLDEQIDAVLAVWRAAEGESAQ